MLLPPRQQTAAATFQSLTLSRRPTDSQGAAWDVRCKSKPPGISRLNDPIHINAAQVEQLFHGGYVQLVIDKAGESVHVAKLEFHY